MYGTGTARNLSLVRTANNPGDALQTYDEKINSDW